VGPVLVVTAVANLAVSPFVPEQSQPVRWHSDGSLRGLVFSERESVTVRYSVYEDLRALAGGDTLIVPPGRLFDLGLVEEMALMDVVVREYDPTVVPGGSVSSSGATDVRQQYTDYVILDGTGPEWWVAIDGSTLVIVPISVASVPGGSE